MTSKAKKRARLKNGTNAKSAHKSRVSLAPDLKLNSDYGKRTETANANTVLVPIKDDPNNHAYLYRINSVDLLEGKLSLRELQAAREVQAAYLVNAQLSSGSPLKERVQSSPKPDHTIAVQVEARSRLVRAMAAVRASERHIVEQVCWHDIRMGAVAREGFPRTLARFRIAMNRVADHLGY